jgi:hypothetical protein
MTREQIRTKALDLAGAVQEFDTWDAESDRPKMVEIEFDEVWKLVVVWEGGFRTIQLHERLATQ